MIAHNRYHIAVISILFLCLFTHCTLYRSMQARKLLSKCEYSLEKVALRTFDFTPVITFDNNKNIFSLEKPSKDLIPLLDDIRNRRFDCKLKTLSFTTFVKITNPNNQHVELDSMFFKAYLDKHFVATVVHREHVVIPSSKSKTVIMYLSVPVSVPLNKIRKSEYMLLDGTVWLKLAVVGKRSITVPHAVSIKKAIPRKKLEAELKKKKSLIVRTLLKKINKNAPSLINKGKELFNKLF